jgi:hypothetical protein
MDTVYSMDVVVLDVCVARHVPVHWGAVRPREPSVGAPPPVVESVSVTPLPDGSAFKLHVVSLALKEHDIVTFYADG